MPPPGFLQVEPWLVGLGPGLSSALNSPLPSPPLTFQRKPPMPRCQRRLFFSFGAFHIGVSVSRASNRAHASCPLCVAPPLVPALDSPLVALFIRKGKTEHKSEWQCTRCCRQPTAQRPRLPAQTFRPGHASTRASPGPAGRCVRGRVRPTASACLGPRVLAAQALSVLPWWPSGLGWPCPRDGQAAQCSSHTWPGGALTPPWAWSPGVTRPTCHMGTPAARGLCDSLSPWPVLCHPCSLHTVDALS